MAGGSREPLTMADLAAIPITRLKSVGAGKRAESFAKFGITNLLELLTHYPRRWIDRTREATVAEAVEGVDAVVIGDVVAVDAPAAFRRGRGPSRVTATVADETGRLQLVFFNQPWRARQLTVGATVAVFGRVGTFRQHKQMANPTVDVLGESGRRPRSIVPVYPQSEKVDLPSWVVGRAVEEALTRCVPRGIDDPLDAEVRAEYSLCGRQEALRGIHLPDSFAHKEMARRRLAFDELLRVQIALVARKKAMEIESIGIRHRVDGDVVKRFHASLPYALTGAQRRVIAEIERDMAGPHPMHRLLQGDVGSGKTVVAVSAMMVAVQGGYQGALMAPTEVLAEQHWTGIRSLVAGLTVVDDRSLLGERPVRVELLTGSVTGERRREVLAGIAAGNVDVVVGTHALIQESVEFRSLGVVVVDEQHRFGVEQRAALRAKGAVVPDVLVMTATPIPRTAAMTVYGDLDVSVLDEKPAGRTPIVTRHAEGPEREAEVWEAVRHEVGVGRQAYVVCPLIEESESVEVASAEETAQRLEAGALAGLRLAVLHGRLSSAEKESIMDRFRRGSIDVLVATTVIEVGVDVPNATIMVILDADRFGISQLHQLRGRVGRGSQASFCWLVTSAKDDALVPASNPRIDALVESDDGFHLAEVDLDLRGEGTLMNKEQKGRSDLKLASLRRDRELVSMARDVAEQLVDDDPTLARVPALRDELVIFLRPEDEEFLHKS
ncbi:MAG: ATP-dependent DNA helicase RecG [Ilumatobacteraceae bacterium]